MIDAVSCMYILYYVVIITIGALQMRGICPGVDVSWMCG